MNTGTFLDDVAARTAAPGGGAVAAVTAAAAAALVAMAARFSDADPTRADELRARLERLADDDAAAYTAVLASRGAARAEALRHATEVPRQIAAAAAEVATLADELAASGNQNLLGDSRVASLVASAAEAAARVLVDLNTGAG